MREKTHFPADLTCKLYGKINSLKNSLKIDVFIFRLEIWVASPKNHFLLSLWVSLPHVTYVMKKGQNLKLPKSCQFWSWLFRSFNFKALYLPNYMSNNLQIWHGDRTSQYLHILTDASRPYYGLSKFQLQKLIFAI